MPGLPQVGGMIRPRPTWVNRRNKVPWDTQSQAQTRFV